MKRIRVVIADDHALVRAGIRALLEPLDDIEVVGEAGNGKEALTLVEKLRPDVLLMDVVMPVMNGLDATARVCASAPKTRVIILSMNSTPEYVLQSLRAGAAGYLLKDDGPAVLEAAIRAVARGENYLCSGVSKYVVSGYVHRDRGVERLTPRQREVLQLIAEGATTKQMARKLGISAKTVETHRSQLMQALDIHDVAGLVRYAIRMGLIVPT